MLTSVDILTIYGAYATALRSARYFFGWSVENGEGIEQITSGIT